MAVKNAGATGACSAYLELIEITFETLNEEKEDGEHIRVGPEGSGGTSGNI
jgi:hypothetical protein